MTERSDDEDTEEDDKKALFIADDIKEDNSQTHDKAKQPFIVFMILSLQFLALCSDTVIYPFFPKVAYDRGISNTNIGVVFSSYDLARFVASPIFGSLVSFAYFLSGSET